MDKTSITRDELARDYKVSRKTLYNWFKKHGIKVSSGHLCPKEIESIYEKLGKP